MPARIQVVVLPLVLVAACTKAGAGGCTSSSEANTLHELRLPGLDGSRFYLGDHRGKIIVIVFWSVHCVPCHRQLMDLSKHPIVRNESVKLISVCVDPEDRALVEQGNKMANGKIEVFLDHHRRVATSLGIEAEPTTLFIDQKGREFSRMVGYSATTISRIERNVALLEESKGK